MAQGRISIYDYADFASFLSAVVDSKRLQRKTFSLRNFTKRIGLKAPSLLTMVMSGDRQPSPMLLNKICSALNLSKQDTRYALTLVAFHKAKNADEKSYLAEQLVAMKPRQSGLVLELHQLRMFSNWCYGALLLLPDLLDFDPSLEWISSRIGGHLSPTEVKEALFLLVDLGVIEMDCDGRYKRINDHTESQSNVPIEIVRKWHKEMMSLAKLAIDAQAPLERFFMGTTLTFDSSKIKEVQEYLNEVRKDFQNRFSEGAAKEIYHLGIQFFRLTAQHSSRP